MFSDDLVKKALVSHLKKRGKTDVEAESLATANLSAAVAYLESRVSGFSPGGRGEELRAKYDSSYVVQCAYADLKSWSASL